MPIIENLTISYGNRKVLNSLTLKLEEGLIHGLIGLNGAGKTTLFNCICGFVKPISGSIQWQQRPLSRKDIALLETQNYFYSNITGREYLELFPSPGVFQLDSWQALFQLPLDSLIETYSTGMKKKLAIMGVIKLDRDIYLMDEPFNGVDIETAVVIKMLIKKLGERGKTILLTSHIVETLHGLCDFIHHLEDGEIKKSYRGSEFERLSREIVQDIQSRAEKHIDQAFSAEN